MKAYKEGIIFYLLLIAVIFAGWIKACRIPVTVNGSTLKFVKFGTSLGEFAKKEGLKTAYIQTVWTETGKLTTEKKQTNFFVDGQKRSMDFKFYKPSQLTYHRKIVSFSTAKPAYYFEEPDPAVIGKGPFLKFHKEGLPELIAVYKNIRGEEKKTIRQGRPAVYIKTDGVKEKALALTFDDGPSIYTREIISVLRKNGIKATFFMVGLNVLQKPDIARMVASEGHLIGNHTLSHSSLRKRQLWFLEREIIRNEKIITDICGVKPVWVRPPYMHYDSFALSFIRKRELEVALWTVDSEDWKVKRADSIYMNVISNLKPGAVILMHDGGGNRSETVKALERIIREAHRRGYIFVTLADFSKLKSKSE
jgi:peptidoglycan/xylan/chitin deacetylase (PgdA/CDA1 family)